MDEKDKRIAELEAQLVYLARAAQKYLKAPPARRGTCGVALREATEGALKELGAETPRVFLVQPYLCAEYPFTLNDGKTTEAWPMQIFAYENGGFELRLGRNIISFDATGAWCNGESAVAELTPNGPEMQALGDAWNRQGETVGKAPARPYYEPQSGGWHRETAGWPGRQGMH